MKQSGLISALVAVLLSGDSYTESFYKFPSDTSEEEKKKNSEQTICYTHFVKQAEHNTHLRSISYIQCEVEKIQCPFTSYMLSLDIRAPFKRLRLQRMTGGIH